MEMREKRVIYAKEDIENDRYLKRDTVENMQRDGYTFTEITYNTRFKEYELFFVYSIEKGEPTRKLEL